MQLEFSFCEGRLGEALTWSISHRRCAEATQAQHIDHKRWLLEHFTDLPLDQVNFAAVHAYVVHEQARGLMNISIRKRLATLQMSLTDAYRRGLIDRKPDWFPRLEGDSVPGKDLWTFTEWRVGRLAFEPDQRIGIDVMFWTGMHLSDVLRWQRRDVDFATGPKGEWRRYNTKSKATPTMLPMPEELRDILDEWFAKEGIVSAAHKVAPLFWQFPVKSMAKVCTRAGLPRITPLGLRRSCVSYMFELGAKKGMTPEAIADWCALWLGHKGDPRTSSIIRTHYRRWTPEAIRTGNPF